MGVGDVMTTGHSAMVANKAAIATTGHNIANANTKGYSRQRVQFEAQAPQPGVSSKGMIGKGVLIDSVERVNDEYLEKQLRDGNRDKSHLEEKEMSLGQVENIFNELDGDGLNRVMSRFFNEFRKLTNDPDSEAIRQSVREASQALVNDFQRIRNDINLVRNNIDSRLEGYTQEVNSLGSTLKNLNNRIAKGSVGGALPNDLLDQRDKVIRDIASYMDVQTQKDEAGNISLNIRGIGPFVVGPQVLTLGVERGPADEEGKVEGSYNVVFEGATASNITHTLKGGKIGGLLDVRDRVLSRGESMLDELAFSLTERVNSIHEKGFNRNGTTGVKFFRDLGSKHRAAEYIGLSREVSQNVNNIASASRANAAGDNRVAIALTQLQGQRLMNDGKVTMDDWYNSIVTEVGVARGRTREQLNQHKNILLQLDKIRDQISGVSIDEETANLMRYQHTFDASARVIATADEMLNTVLNIKRL